MRNRLIESLKGAERKYLSNGMNIPQMAEFIADEILADGWMRPPCKVGQTVYYISKNPINLSVQANTIYEADVVRIVTTHLGTSLVIQIHNEYGCTEIPDINKWGEEVFSSREEAEKALKEGEQ